MTKQRSLVVRPVSRLPPTRAPLANRAFIEKPMKLLTNDWLPMSPACLMTLMTFPNSGALTSYIPMSGWPLTPAGRRGSVGTRTL